MLPYGVAQNNYLYPNMLSTNAGTSSISWNRLVNLLTMSYFHIFGEIFPDQILDMAPPDYEGCGLANSKDSRYLCPEKVSYIDSILASESLFFEVGVIELGTCIVPFGCKYSFVKYVNCNLHSYLQHDTRKFEGNLDKTSI